MRHLILVALVCLLPACGGSSSPTSPSPQPTQPTRISGTITDTLTGASVGTFSSEASVFPARVSVSSAGYVTRDTWVRSASPTVDLIPESGFDVGFYRQFARGTLEDPMQPLRVLSQAPSIYLQTAGMQPSTVAAFEQAARDVVPALTGGRFQVAGWETGADVRAPLNGWIVAELVNDEAQGCGRSLVGAAAGHIWLNTATRCRRNGDIVATASVFAHEIGHALGFFHVDRADALMLAQIAPGKTPSDLERRHAAIAYHRSAGNTDVDTDPVAPAAFRAIIIE